MQSNIELVVFVVVAVLTIKSFGAVRFPSKGNTEAPIEITTTRQNTLPNNLSVSGQSRKLQKINEDSKETAHNDNVIDRLDTSATHHIPTNVLQGFGNGNALDFYSTLFGYQPYIFNTRGLVTPQNLLQFVPATNFPYLTATGGLAPLVSLGPCSLECEYFAIQHRNAFPFFHHGTGSRPVHDLAEYHGPDHNTPGFQHNRFPYTTPGVNRAEHHSARHGGGQVRYPIDGRDVDHTKTPPQLLQDRVNGEYAPPHL